MWGQWGGGNVSNDCVSTYRSSVYEIRRFSSAVKIIYRQKLTVLCMQFYRFVYLLTGCSIRGRKGAPLHAITQEVTKAVREAATICPAPCKLTFDLLTFESGSESRVTWATSVPVLVFLGLSVLDLGPMYATDRQTDVRSASSLNASAPWERGHNKIHIFR